MSQKDTAKERIIKRHRDSGADYATAQKMTEESLTRVQRRKDVDSK